jgi:capsular polysaccharide export protein
LELERNSLLCPGSAAIALRDYKLWRLPGLNVFLGCPVTVGSRLRPDIQAWVGWGYKKSGQRAARIASRRGLPCWRLEDGFLRSVDLGNRDRPLSLVIDDIGMYYDAGGPSRLESLVARPLGPDQSNRARAMISAWQAGRVSKYNYLREYTFLSAHAGRLGETDGVAIDRYVLVVDQTFADASVRFGLACPKSFKRMFQAALDENPGCTVLVKIHPEVFAGRKKGYFDLSGLAREGRRVKVLAEDVHPAGLIEHAEAVYAVTSQVGFEALLWNKPVRVFGMPFYAGWGLTDDDLVSPQRRGKASLKQLVHAALVDYPRYVNPETGKRCEVEEVLGHIALQRRMRERFSPEIYALGFSIYKRPIVRRFFGGSKVCFISDAKKPLPGGATIATWDSTPMPKSLPESAHLIRLEDGFLRSVGLGSDLVQPISWIVDGKGIYYDPGTPSDLEHLLQHGVVTPDAIERAANLRQRIVQHGLTKYNIDAKHWKRPDWPGCRVILVPGQVETDASIRFGAPQIKTNIALLRAVREANPSAYVLYKPHPDVVAGLRRKGMGEEDASRWCDEILIDTAMHALIEAVDELHVLTSLAGFEGLLRGKKVVAYGQPFYAGWGLTHDMLPLERRTRKLSLDELVAGVLIEYPTYVSRTTGRFTTPERALDELLTWRRAALSGLPWWRKGLRWVLRWRKR